MRIGVSTSVIQRGKTGVAEYVFSLLRALGRYSNEHEFVLFVLEEDLPLFDFAHGKMEVVSVSERYRPPVRNVLWHQTRLPRLARALHLDVIHVPSYRRMLWRSSCAKVATIHDLAAFHVARKYDWKRMFYGRVVAASLARRQHELIAVSENTARDMGRFWNIPRQTINVIHHGIDFERFSTQGIQLARTFCRQRFDLEHPFFLYVSRLEHPAKNHVRLIAAFEQFKARSAIPWELVFAGSDWHGAEHIHAAIAGSPARTAIRTLGFVSKHELPLLYRSAGIFVYPSLYEGFGFPVLEAMASGTPVICSTRGSLAEISGDAALTVNPEDIESIADQMVRLVADEMLRGKLRELGLAWSRRFDWEQTAQQTLRVYQNAVDQAAARKRGEAEMFTRLLPLRRKSPSASRPTIRV